jgi:hypothetical protein
MGQLALDELYCTLDPDPTVFLLVNLCQLRRCRFTIDRLLPIGGVRVGEKGQTMRREKFACLCRCLKAELALNER